MRHGKPFSVAPKINARLASAAWIGWHERRAARLLGSRSRGADSFYKVHDVVADGTAGLGFPTLLVHDASIRIVERARRCSILPHRAMGQDHVTLLVLEHVVLQATPS